MIYGGGKKEKRGTKQFECPLCNRNLKRREISNVHLLGDKNRKPACPKGKSNLHDNLFIPWPEPLIELNF